MSTRCQILVEGATVVLYRHSDGYPDGPTGVIVALKKILKKFIPASGFDEIYLPAHIISSMIVEHHKDGQRYARMMVKAGTPKEQADKIAKSSAYLGFGVEGYKDSVEGRYDTLHGDIEFLYVVKKNGTIEVRQCFNDNDKASNIENTTVVKTIKYAK